MLFSAASSVVTPLAAAQSIASAQSQSAGTLLFPGDFVNFAQNAAISYVGIDSAEATSAISGTMLELPNFNEVFPEALLPAGQQFYGWSVEEDTVPTDGKRTNIKLRAIFISYNSEKADLSVSFPESAAAQASVTLTPKSGYTLLSVADGFSYDAETKQVTGAALSEVGATSQAIIALEDVYSTEVPTVTILDAESNPVSTMTVCPKNTAQYISLSATAKNSTGVLDEAISWSITGAPDNVTVYNTGIVTISPDFSAESFEVKAECLGGAASVTVTLSHSYGEWRAGTLPEHQGKEVRTCACGANDVRDAQKDVTAPTGTITMGEKSWSELASSPAFSEFVKNAELTISATDASGIKEISYLLSDAALTSEQLAEKTDWTVGKNVTVSTDSKFILYAKITDNADNVSYISSVGITVDTTAPVISGIENGSVYYDTAPSFTVTDANLDKVFVNGDETSPANGAYSITPASAKTQYSVKAIDKAGNSAEYTVSILTDTVSANNTIAGITQGATYRKGSTISFSATGTEENGYRYIPTSYTLDGKSCNFTATYSLTATVTISTGNLSVGTHTVSVLFAQQSYSNNAWQNTGKYNTQTTDFKLEKREEIERVRATLKASFYTVKFETNGGSKLDYVLVNRLKTVSEPIAPTKNGYKFDGWYSDKALTKEYDFSSRVTENLTLYAKWTQTSSDNPFSDVSKDDWYYDNIAYVYATGLMNGTGDEAFSPDMPTTRAMIVTILYRLEGQPSVTGAHFSDVSKDLYYSDAVWWAHENNIVNGTSENVFSPNKEITREQLMTILYRYAAYKDYDISSKTSLSGYTDYDQISTYAADAFGWAVATKVATGRTATFLSPKASATRAEVASAFKNFMEGNE